MKGKFRNRVHGGKGLANLRILNQDQKQICSSDNVGIRFAQYCINFAVQSLSTELHFVEQRETTKSRELPHLRKEPGKPRGGNKT